MKKLSETEYTERLTQAELAKPLTRPFTPPRPSMADTRAQAEHKARIGRLAASVRSSGPVQAVRSYAPAWRKKDRVSLGFTLADVADALHLLGTDVDEDTLVRMEAAETFDDVWEHPAAETYRRFLTVTRTGDQP